MVQRLLAPRHIAVFGGRPAAEVIRQCRRIGFAGEIWPVHPSHEHVEGLACFRSVDALPAAPDASFIAVPREATIAIVGALARRGAGGAVCYASGFAEVGDEGARLQQQLVAAARDMPLIGPNCYGVLNCLDGAALWPDQHGAQRVQRGVAVIAQSGNIGINLTMQRRGLPLAYLMTLGNQAGTGLAEAMQALLDDTRVSAIGLHIEGIADVPAFTRAAMLARRRGVPVVALKCGSSAQGASIALSHTRSMAGADTLVDALFNRLGIARVHDVAALVETLKLLHVHGALHGRRIVSASCSGGEATLVADLAEQHGLELPALPPRAQGGLKAVLGDAVHVTNPLDYHTYIWGDHAAQTECFTAMLGCGFDLHLLVLDFPRNDRCSDDDWSTTLSAFVAAQRRTGAAAAVISSLPESLPEPVAEALLAEGIAPLHGLSDGLGAIAAAARIGTTPMREPPLPAVAPREGAGEVLDEWRSKQALAAFGVPVPRGELVAAAEVVACAEALGYPVALKAVSSALAHKTEAGAVRLNLRCAADVSGALASMQGLSSRFLVERMAQDVVAELIVGVQRDAQFGLALTLGAGGVLVELLKDATTLLLPATPQDIEHALRQLRVWPLLTGYRGRPAANMPAVLNAVAGIAAFAEHHADRLLELDVNPLLVLPQGALAVDALVRWTP